MVIFGNMQVLPFLSRFLTSLRYQNGYYGCRGSQRYHYGRFVLFKRPFVSTIMGGLYCLNALLLAPKSDCVEINRRQKRAKKTRVKKYIFFKIDAKIFSSMKKHKESNAIGFESVPLNIKIDVFSVKKEHTFSGLPHI